MRLLQPEAEPVLEAEAEAEAQPFRLPVGRTIVEPLWEISQCLSLQEELARHMRMQLQLREEAAPEAEGGEEAEVGEEEEEMGVEGNIEKSDHNKPKPNKHNHHRELLHHRPHLPLLRPRLSSRLALVLPLIQLMTHPHPPYQLLLTLPLLLRPRLPLRVKDQDLRVRRGVQVDGNQRRRRRLKEEVEIAGAPAARHSPMHNNFVAIIPSNGHGRTR